MADATCIVVERDGTRCSNPLRYPGRGWCMKHYKRWQVRGDPLTVLPSGRRPGFSAPAERRFWPKVDKNGPVSERQPELGPCWLWTAARSRDGYGKFMADEGFVYAHRWVFEHLLGPIPKGLKLDHLCHNADLTCQGGVTCLHRRCVNPAHLEPAMHRDNILRGRTIPAAQAAKTHCVNGHEFTEATTYWWKGHRTCKTCGRERARGYRKARRAAI